MSAAEFELDIDEGSTFILNLQLVNEDESVINITGDTFAGQIRKAPESTTVVANFSSTIVDAPNGKFNMTLSSSVTAGITVDDSGDCLRATTCYVYDIERTKANGDVERLLQGLVNVSPEVSR